MGRTPYQKTHTLSPEDSSELNEEIARIDAPTWIRGKGPIAPMTRNYEIQLNHQELEIILACLHVMKDNAGISKKEQLNYARKTAFAKVRKLCQKARLHNVVTGEQGLTKEDEKRTGLEND